MFVNGTQVGSTFGDGTSYLINADRPIIGAFGYDLIGKLTGYINELRITIGVARYTSTFNPKSIVDTSDPYWSSTYLYLKGGSSIRNSNTVTDSSAKSTQITASVSQGTFSPFMGLGFYSAYFDGGGDHLTGTNTIVFGTSDFTIEFWIYPTSLPNDSWTTFISIGDNAGGREIRISQNIGGQGFGYLIPNNTNNGHIYRGYGVLEINQWHHIALVRNGSIVAFYKNGEVVAFNSGVSFNFNPSSNITKVGMTIYGARDGYFKGYISNLRITKSVVYDTKIIPNFSVPTEPLKIISDTQLLICSDVILVNSAVDYVDYLTVSGSVKVTTWVPFIKPYSISKMAGSYYLNNSSIVANISVDYAIGGLDFTFECWIYPLATGTFNLVDNRPSGTDGYYFNLSYTTNTNISLIVNGTIQTTTTVGPKLGSWNHVVYVKTNGIGTIFLNGNAVGSTNDVFNYLDTYWNFGYSPDSTKLLTAYITGIRVVNSAIYTAGSDNIQKVEPTLFNDPNSNSVVLLLNANGYNGKLTNTFIDNGPNNFTVSSTGNPSLSTFSPFASTNDGYYSVYFNGSNNYLYFDSDPAFSFDYGDFTVECWVYISDLPNNNHGKMIIDTRPWSGNGTFWFLGITSGGYLNFNQGISEKNISSPSTFPIGQWAHIAVSRFDSELKMFLNGSIVASIFSTANILSSGLRIGVNSFVGNAPDTYFDGYISNVRVVKSMIYNSEFTPPISPLTNIPGTILLTCQSGSFIDNSDNRFSIAVNANPVPVKFFPFKIVEGNYSTSIIGGSAYFSNVNYLYIQQKAALSFGTASFTIECWICPISLTTYAGVIEARSAATSQDWACGLRNSGGSYKAELYLGSPLTAKKTISLNVWTHVAWVRNSDNGVLSIFVNGILDTSWSKITRAINANGISQRIGALVDGGGYYTNGYISNLRVVNGTALYTSDFEPNNGPLSSISNTTLLLKMDSIGIFDETFNNPVGVYGSVTIDSAITKFGSGSLYFDGTGKNLIGNYNYGSYLAIPNNSELFQFNNNDFTVEFWAYPTDISTISGLICKGTYTTGWAIFIDAAGYWSLAEANKFTSSSVNAISNRWQHIAYNRYGNLSKLLVDGLEAISLTSFTNLNQTNTLLIGRTYSNRSDLVYIYTGYIDALRISKGLARYPYQKRSIEFTDSPPTVSSSGATIETTSLLLLADNAFVSDSTNKNIFMVSGNVSVSADTFKSQPNSLYFDGTGYVFSSNRKDFLTDNFTVELWINAKTFEDNPVLIDCRQKNTNGNYFTLYLNSNGNPIYYTASANRITGPVLSVDTWYHIAVCRVNSNIRMFVNGTQMVTTYNDGNSYSADSSSPIIGGSGYAPNSNLFVGYIDELRITFAARYTTNFEISLIGNDFTIPNANNKYIIVPDTFSALEGDPITFTIKTFDISNGTVLYWSTIGTATADRFTGDTTNSGTVTIIDDRATVVKKTFWNGIDDGLVTVGIKLLDESGTILAQSELVELDDRLDNVTLLDYLVVAGGGGGGLGGGGGAGGVLYKSSDAFRIGQTYYVTVGAGGQGTAYSANGENSSIIGVNKKLIAYGGGAGATRDFTQPGAGVSGTGYRGANGGSGGGGGGNSNSNDGGNAGGSGTIFQGSNGGRAPGASNTPSCGGGGAGADAASGGTTPGGIGLSDDQVGGLLSAASAGEVVSNVRYIGGGGGGGSWNAGGAAGGAGGGGTGTSNGGTPTAGKPNTGGGGGGRASGAGGESGGSGIVIIRCLDSAASAVTGDPQVINGEGYKVYVWKNSGSFTF
jgi:hypothetical protein